MRPLQKTVLAAVCAVVAGSARPAGAVLSACTAADITSQNASDCPNNTNPCTISKDFNIGNGCTLDFGTRAVTLKGGTNLNILANTATIKAGSFTIAASGKVNARGDQATPNDRGGFVTIQTTGAVNIQKASNSGTIDISGIVASGALRIIAGGTVTIDGKILGDNLSPTASGGDIAIDAGGDIIMHAGATLQANSGSGISGEFDLTANGRIDLADVVDLGGGDGGTLSLDAGADVALRLGMIGDASGDAGAGGELDITAGTSVLMAGPVTLRGTSSADQMSGGCGGTVDAESRFGDLTVNGNILADGATPDGGGGSIMLTSSGKLILNSPAQLTARGGGSQSCGGELCFTVTKDYQSSATLDVSAGAGGGTIDIETGGSITQSAPMIASATTTTAFGGEIDLASGEGGPGNITLSSTLDVTGGDCDTFGTCGQGGVLDIFGCNITAQSTSSMLLRGGYGGTTTLTAREQLTVQGPITATKVVGPGLDGTNTFLYKSTKPPIVTGVVTPAATSQAKPTCIAFDTPSGCLTPCPTCGNGIIEYPETCDTAGTPVSCDGCSYYCQLENCNDSNVCTTDSCDPTLGCRNVPVADGTSCSDGLVCNGVETCLSGLCLAAPLNCNDGNSCTTDTCVEPTGCLHVNAVLGSSCSDGNACTSGDTCNATGTCQPGPATVCNDNRECTTDTCNPATGCVFTNRSGSCTDDGNQCTSDVCNTGNCTHPVLPNGTTCNDGQFCTINDACQSGVCLGGTPRDCSDTNQCTIDSCNESTDQCVHSPASAGSGCNDNNACTVGDACDANGVCQPGPLDSCNDNNECTDDTCSPGSGCVHTPRGGVCTDDGNPCTTDVCSAGACTHPAKANGTSCEDGQFCTNPDVCQGGFCQPGPARSCNDGNPCTTDSCNESTDTCDHTNLGAGSTCTDGNACTVGDTCDASGTCQPGAAANCNDNNECTDDSCNPSTGCVHTPHVGSCTDDGNVCTNDVCSGTACTHPAKANGTACNDGAFCTVNDSCQGGTCTGAARDCSDASPCTTDSCNEATDTCDHVSQPVNSPCSDGNACTVGDACDASGQCVPGPVTTCDDGNECTTDSCNPSTGCAHVNRTGACTDDGNTCTTDVCNAGACTHPAKANGTPCDDGQFCTANDSCQSGSCVSGPARNCNDGNACTTDSCDETNDVCAHVAIVPCCGDGVTQSPEQCDDGNTVDTDACRNNCQLAVCGDGVVRTGFEQCDQGNANSDAPDAACRTNCQPRRCGDGIVDPNAGEQCDDGNTASGDGCSSSCVYELSPTAQRIPGGKVTSTKECVFEWATEHAVLDKNGIPTLKQTCKDGDPACDFGNTPGECTFHVWMCANNHDARFTVCNPGPGGAGTLTLADVKKPSAKSLTTHPEDTGLRNRLLQSANAIQSQPADTCGPRLDIVVPFKAPGVKGTRPVTLKATATSSFVDSDGLKLICTP